MVRSRTRTFRSRTAAPIAVAPACWLAVLLAGVCAASPRPVSSAQPEPLPGTTGKELRAAWQDLGAIDARQAYKGLFTLVSAPQQAVPLLDEHIANPPVPDLQKVKKHIADLDNKDYKVRALAQQALAKMGMAAAPILEQALAAAPSAEAHGRIKKLLSRLQLSSLSPEQIQVWRGIEALERIGTPAAQKVLARLARGFPGYWQTVQAREALQRLQAKAQPFALAKEIKPLAVLEGHTSRIYDLAFSPNGKLLGSVSYDRTARLWDAATGKLLATLPHGGKLYSVAFSADSRWLLTGGSQGQIRVWDVATHKLVVTLTGAGARVVRLAVSPDGRFLASAGSSDMAQLAELPAGKPFAGLDGHTNSLVAVAFSPDGKTLISATSDRQLKVWETVTGQQRAAVSGQKGLNEAANTDRDTGKFVAVDISHDGRKAVAVTRNGYVMVWDLFTGKMLRDEKILSGTPWAMRHSPTHALFATAGSDACRLWDTATGKELATLDGHTAKVSAAAFRPDGKVLATGSYDTTIRLWGLAAK